MRLVNTIRPSEYCCLEFASCWPPVLWLLVQYGNAYFLTLGCANLSKRLAGSALAMLCLSEVYCSFSPALKSSDTSAVCHTRTTPSFPRMLEYQLATYAETRRLFATPENDHALCLALPGREGALSIYSQCGIHTIWLPLLFGCPCVDARL